MTNTKNLKSTLAPREAYVKGITKGYDFLSYRILIRNRKDKIGTISKLATFFLAVSRVFEVFLRV